MEWLHDLFQTLSEVLDALDDAKPIYGDMLYWKEELEKIQGEIQKLLVIE